MPPIDVYRVGDLHFVRDGHHRVSVARAQGLATIEAYVTEVITRIPPDGEPAARRAGAQEPRAAVLRARAAAAGVPRRRIELSDEWRYAALAEGVEAWGFRYMQDLGELLRASRSPRRGTARSTARSSSCCARRGCSARGTEAEAYMRVSTLRYLLLRTHAWDDEVVERLREALEQPEPDRRGHARPPAAQRARRAAAPGLRRRRAQPSSTTTPSHGPSWTAPVDGLAVARPVGRRSRRRRRGRPPSPARPTGSRRPRSRRRGGRPTRRRAPASVA